MLVVVRFGFTSFFLYDSKFSSTFLGGMISLVQIVVSDMINFEDR